MREREREREFMIEVKFLHFLGFWYSLLLSFLFFFTFSTKNWSTKAFSKINWAFLVLLCFDSRLLSSTVCGRAGDRSDFWGGEEKRNLTWKAAANQRLTMCAMSVDDLTERMIVQREWMTRTMRRGRGIHRMKLVVQISRFYSLGCVFTGWAFVERTKTGPTSQSKRRKR